jgi:hypothetical protein
MTTITADMLDAIKVQFLKPIFEDDFPERGMTAWLVRVTWDQQIECYKLFFDFTEFESINEKYFTDEYWPNRHTRELGIEKPLYSAREAGMYNPKYSVYFSYGTMVTRNDTAFAEAIKEHLKVCE